MKRRPLSFGLPDKRWKELYIAALFETDKSKMPRKIAEAQIAIINRRRKAMSGTSDTKERQALDTALLSLQALANCLAITARPPQNLRDSYMQAAMTNSA